MQRKCWSLILLCFTLLACMRVAWSQENGTLTGTIADASGAVVPDAAVAITNTATGQVRQDKSNPSGIYLFADLGVGTYSLTVTAPGFQTYTKTGITLNVAQTLQENASLTAGSAGEVVSVRANALQVQAETSELSTLITGDQVRQLATNGRNVTALAALGAGVSSGLSDFGGVNALTSSNAISFNGTRSSHNVYLLDGGELNDRGCGGCFSSLPSIDALSEFQTLNSNYGPDYGLGSGGTITMVIKSGTSQLHGELYEFNRNEDYDANNYFTNLAGKPRPEFRLNNPGGNIGGPVYIPHIYDGRKRTFFFVNEEWRRLIQGSAPSIVNTIAANNFPVAGQPLVYTTPAKGVTPIVPPTSDPARLALYAADGLTPGSPFPNNTIPANLMDPNAVIEVNAGTFPHPNYGNSQYVSSIPQPTNVREDVVRIDHAINSKLQLMGHYLHDQVTQTYFPPLWSDGSYPTVGTAMANPSWSSTVRLTQTLTPNLLNETAFLYSGNTIHLSPVGTYVQPAGWSQTTFFPAANNFESRLPEIDLGAPYGTNWSSSYFPWKNSYEGYETRDDITWNQGRNQWKFGFSWLHDPKNQQLQANTQGTAVFNNSTFSLDPYINFLLGDTASFTQLQYLAGKHWVNNNYSFYGNDNWKVTRNVTLNLGVRYDGMPHAFERFNQFANFYPADYNRGAGYPLNPDGTLNSAYLTNYNGQPFYLNGIREADVNGFPRGVVKNDYATVEPRVGFAYDIGGQGKTVIRGGFGTFYERVQGNDVYNAALNPPFAYQPSANSVYFSNTNTSALTGITTTQAFPSTMTNLNYNYHNPGTAMFSLGVQRQLASSVIAQIAYGGSLGWDQSDDRSINTLPLTANDPASPNNPYYDRQIVAGGQQANLYRIYPGFSTITQEENETNTSYNSLQTSLRMEHLYGATVSLAYTYSHEIDETSADLNALSDPFNPEYDRSSGLLDRRHVFTASYIYAFPWFNNSSNDAARTILGGWEFSGITIAQSGVPQPLTYTGTDTLGLGGGTTNRPDQIAPVQYTKKLSAWFNPSSFAAPVAPWMGGANQGFGNAPRDAIVLPGRLNFNLSLFKTINFKAEGPNLELRFESFNTFNHTQFNGIDANTGDANFGAITSAYDPRTLQLGAKLHF